MIATTKNETDSAKSAVLHGATVSRQLNGTSLYVVFDGSEQAITDAYTALWNANAYGGELEWLCDTQACVVSSVSQFRRGLVNRELLHLIIDDSVCRAAKHTKGGLKSLAESKGVQFWDSMKDVRVITPRGTTAPYLYRVGNNTIADTDMSGD